MGRCHCCLNLLEVEEILPTLDIQETLMKHTEMLKRDVKHCLMCAGI